MRVFEGVEMSFGQLRSCLQSLIYFWCAHVVRGCIEDWASFVGNHIFCRSFYFLAYFSYTDDFGLLIL